MSVEHVFNINLLSQLVLLWGDCDRVTFTDRVCPDKGITFRGQGRGDLCKRQVLPTV